ncbi:MAG: hypothetical protein IT210_08365 [Armatimonadetes bacterium]|nr:hypothetical protein [Armatimonadota bacterium]
MLSRERFFLAIRHREPDRVPLHLWIFNQPGITQRIEAAYGSINAFYDALSIDLWQTFPDGGLIDRAFFRKEEEPAGPTNIYGHVLTLDDLLDGPFTDPDDSHIYRTIRADVAHHKGRCGRVVTVQTPGVFECSTGMLGLQESLMNLALEPEKMAALFDRIAAWAVKYIDNCLDIGVDVIHVSDDWGMNNALLFRPKVWWEMIFPATRTIARHVKRREAPLSLHSDGDVTSVLDGIVELGFDILHPVQVSAGMNQKEVKERFAPKLTVCGGLDVRTTLGRGQPERTRQEIIETMRAVKPGGGFIFNTSHMVQPDTPLEEVEMVYALALEEGAYNLRG